MTCTHTAGDVGNTVAMAARLPHPLMGAEVVPSATLPETDRPAHLEFGLRFRLLSLQLLALLLQARQLRFQGAHVLKTV